MKYEIGQIIYKEDPIILNENRQTIELTVRNAGDRTIQVCSHYHFFESNSALKFEREKSYGMRLDIPPGTATRFEPGVDKKITLVPYGGERKLYGFDGLVMGSLDDPEVKKEALRKGREMY